MSFALKHGRFAPLILVAAFFALAYAWVLTGTLKTIFAVIGFVLAALALIGILRDPRRRIRCDICGGEVGRKATSARITKKDSTKPYLFCKKHELREKTEFLNKEMRT